MSHTGNKFEAVVQRKTSCNETGFRSSFEAGRCQTVGSCVYRPPLFCFVLSVTELVALLGLDTSFLLIESYNLKITSLLGVPISAS